MEAAYTHGDEWLDQLIAYLEENFRILSRELQSAIPELIISPLQATYLAWLDFSFLKLDDDALKTFMIRKSRLGLNDGPMFGPGGEQHQRLNLATPAERLKEGIRRIIAAVQSAD
jgi:cystathionine beta-lyase